MKKNKKDDECLYDCPLGKEKVSTKIKLKKNKKRISVPEYKLKVKNANKEAVLAELSKREPQILKELKEGLNAISSYPKSVTIFGSARLAPGSKYYELTRKLAGEISKIGYAVITGGGPGIMQAGNQGTLEAVGSSIGFNIELPFEQSINPYVTHGVNFHYFFTRKLAMNFSGEAYICMPGGFGTLDEFFQILTLVQTKKVQKVPIILFGKKFWNPILKYSQNTLLKEFGTISKSDLDLFKVTDDIDEVLKIVKKAKPRQEYYN